MTQAATYLFTTTHMDQTFQPELYFRKGFSMQYNTPGKAPGYDRTDFRSRYIVPIIGSTTEFGNSVVELDVKKIIPQWEKITEKRTLKFTNDIYPILRSFIFTNSQFLIEKVKYKTFFTEFEREQFSTSEAFEPISQFYFAITNHLQQSKAI